MNGLYGTAVRLTARRRRCPRSRAGHLPEGAACPGRASQPGHQSQGLALHHPPQHLAEPPARRRPGAGQPSTATPSTRRSTPAAPASWKRTTPETLLLRHRARRRPAGGARPAARDVPRGGVAARRRGPQLPGDCRRAVGADRHRDVADLARPQAAPRLPHHGARGRRRPAAPAREARHDARAPRAGGDCRQIEALLPPFVDGAGSAMRSRPRRRPPGACCPPAARRRKRRRRSGGCCAPGAERCVATAPPGLDAQVRAAAASAPAELLGPAGGCRRWRPPRRWSLAVTGAFAWSTGRSSVLLAAQLTLDHIKCFLVDGADHAEHFTAPTAPKRGCSDQFGWSVPIPAPAARPTCTWSRCGGASTARAMVAHVLYRVEASRCRSS